MAQFCVREISESFVLLPQESRRLKNIDSLHRIELVSSEKSWVVQESYPLGLRDISCYVKGRSMRFLIATDGVYAIPRKLWKTWPDCIAEVTVPENRLPVDILEQAPEPEI
jgi:hypothetical protein